MALHCLEKPGFVRAGWEIEGGVEFDVRSKDATALRATLNAISQSLIVFEKARKG